MLVKQSDWYIYTAVYEKQFNFGLNEVATEAERTKFLRVLNSIVDQNLEHVNLP